MNIFNIFTELLIYDSPKQYRELRDFYKNNNMPNEAEAFTYLLNERFGELPELNSASPDQKQ